MSEEKKKFPNEPKPWEIPTKRWSADLYDDHAPNGYSLEDEYGWTSQVQTEMYNEAIRDLQVQINVAQEQKKKVTKKKVVKKKK
jgi:hypothetical protein